MQHNMDMKAAISPYDTNEVGRMVVLIASLAPALRESGVLATSPQPMRTLIDKIEQDIARMHDEAMGQDEAIEFLAEVSGKSVEEVWALITRR